MVKVGPQPLDRDLDAAAGRTIRPQEKRGQSEVLGHAGMLLNLQRLAGNRAVTAALLSRPVVVQRHTPGDESDPIQPMGEEAVQQVVQDGLTQGGGAESESEESEAPETETEPEPSGEEASESPLAEAEASAAPPTADNEPAAFGPPPTMSSESNEVSPPPPTKTKPTKSTTTTKTTSPPKAKPKSTRPPKPETRAQLKAKITVTVRSNGAKGEAQARKYIDKVFLSTSKANLKAMASKTIEFNIIPVDKKLTDLAEFASLKGTNTFDGRLWDNVRGIWMGAGATTIRFAVGEEDLGGTKKGSGYGPGFVAGHEGGHGLQNHGLTDEQKKAITKAYTDRKAAHPATQATKEGSADEVAWLQPAWYSAANENEYFASSVAAWWGYPYNDTKEAKERYKKSWLKKEDKPMYDILSSVYGD
jgi:hypothetical protein